LSLWPDGGRKLSAAFYHLAAMHLNIKNDEAHRLATELAALRGESLTAAVTAALRAQLEAERLRAPTGVAARLMAIGRRYAALEDADGRTPDEIIGFDETGSPA